MILSEEGIKHLKKVEGFRNNPYLDSADVATIGYGFTYYPCGGRVKMTDKAITLKEAEAILKQLVESYEEYVDKVVTCDLTQNQFDALVSFCYNVGKKAFKDSTLLKKVNKDPNDPTISDEFKRWKYAGGKVVKGLIKRRNMEAYLYNK
jgi:lysozyme